MDLNFFADPGLAPKPRSEIRIEAFTALPYPDGRRVRIDVEITPFAPGDRPNIEISARKSDGTQVGSTTIVEAVQRTFSLTLHLREPEPSGDYTLHASLYYGEDAPQSTAVQTITVVPGEIEVDDLDS